MPKAKTIKRRKLPAWANEPLKFSFSPDEALKRGAFTKPKAWEKAITTGRKARR
ncbi:MAG: hypothetical protein PHY43_10980 [Verrucomicrobiales bacterium]|nr:hypothetical protein [Verrucomicrobiales bacterium]